MTAWNGKKAPHECACVFLGEVRCRCTPDQVARYRNRISGPLFDRIDLQVEVPALTPEELQHAPPGESSHEVGPRVVAARSRMQERQGKVNALLSNSDVERFCPVDDDGIELLSRAMTALKLSARGYHRILKVARIIADLAGADRIAAAHIAEAVGYRRGLDQR